MPPRLTSSQVTANIEAWQRYATVAAAHEHPARGIAPRRLEWTQIPGLGPGEEILGDVAGSTALELGCGTGENAAVLASRGAHTTGIDAAPTQIDRARTRWGHVPGVTFVNAEAGTYLTQPGPSFTIVLSIFGALDFAPPDLLLPLAAARLRPGGILAISTVHPDWQPPRRLTLDTGATVAIHRPMPEPSWWTRALPEQGLTLDHYQALTTTGEITPCCLLLLATKRSPRPHLPPGHQCPSHCRPTPAAHQRR